MKFGELLKSAATEGKEKHVPVIEIGEARAGEGIDVVRVFVGREVPHPNTVEHHIEWVELYGIKKNDQVVNLGRATFTPVYTNPNARFQINNVEEFKAFCALGYCNIHGVWQDCIEVE